MRTDPYVQPPDGHRCSTHQIARAPRAPHHGGKVKLFHERATGTPVLLAGLLAALNAACGSGAGEDAAKPIDVTREALSTYHATDSAGAVTLRDRLGNPLAPGSTTPYSPQKTCGGCHDVSVITQGYHFQQGKQVVADNYNTAKPWLLSDGMYGKW
jgi:hypothetical protein